MQIRFTARYKKDYKVCMKRGIDMEKVNQTLVWLRDGVELPERMKDHALKGNYKGHRECHIEPDLVLIYRYNYECQAVMAVRVGTHSDVLE